MDWSVREGSVASLLAKSTTIEWYPSCSRADFGLIAL